MPAGGAESREGDIIMEQWVNRNKSAARYSTYAAFVLLAVDFYRCRTQSDVPPICFMFWNSDR